MSIVRGGRAGSGLDRALDHAQRAELDDVLESGELSPGERDESPEPYGPYDRAARPWQMPFSVPRTPPATAESLPAALRGRASAAPTAQQAREVPGALAACPATNQERDATYRTRLGGLRK